MRLHVRANGRVRAAARHTECSGENPIRRWLRLVKENAMQSQVISAAVL